MRVKGLQLQVPVIGVRVFLKEAQPQVIDPLYGLAAGTYDPATGAIRLPEPDLPGFWPAEPGQDGGGC